MGQSESTENDPIAGPGPKGSVVLIREWEGQMSSSGCCGRLAGDLVVQGGERCFPQRRAIMESMGPLYRALRQRYGQSVELRVVDPRNMVSLLPILLRDARAHRVGLLDTLATLFRVGVTSTVVNGRILSRGEWPSVEQVIAELDGKATPGSAKRAPPGCLREPLEAGP